MNISLRPSGGRGEYELAGRHGVLHVHDLLNLPIFIEILPGSVIDAHSRCLLRNGKPRIRLTTPARDAHPSALVAAAMMLPRPRRERSETHGSPLLWWNRFVIQTVRVDVVVQTGRALISPVTIRLENADNLQLDISFAERMSRVLRVWTAAATASDPIADAVRAHAAAFTSRNSTQGEFTGSFEGLHSALGKPASDMLPLLEAHFSIGTVTTLPVGELSAGIANDDFSEIVDVDPPQARIERIKAWRRTSVRGGAAAGFRRNVREAYGARCLLTGQRLPLTLATSTPGVDAAHILPWSRYNLDAVANGLCLNKQMHWAFDEGIIRLAFDPTVNSYVATLPDAIRQAACSVQFDLAQFEAVQGPIPLDRLPANEALWPSITYLGELNLLLDE